MKKKTFRIQLVLSYLLVMALVLGIVFSVVLYSRITLVRDEFQKELDDSAQMVSMQLGFVVKNMSFISTSTLSEKTTVDAMASLANNAVSGTEELETYRVAQSALINYAIVSSIYHITYFNRAGYIIQSDHYNTNYNIGSRLTTADWEKIDWLDRVQNNYGRTVLLPVQDRYFRNTEEQTLMLVRAVRNGQGIIGYLIVETALEDIADILTTDKKNETGLVITDKNGEVIYQSQEMTQTVKTAISSGDWKKAGVLHSSSADEDAGIQVFTFMPNKSMWKAVVSDMGVYFLVGLLVLGIAVAAIILQSERLTKPLVVLDKQMQQADLSSIHSQADRQVMTQYAEIESLYISYNNMQERLHTLIDREIAWKTQQTEQRLETLQAQINPHFMYNTLNMIGIMGLESKNRKVFEACRDFSNLLRYSISDKNGSVSTVGRELENVRNYLGLMQMRLEKACEYEILEDETVSGQTLPRLVLQPLVENVFEHAYDQNTDVVHIKITTTRIADRWQICVCDDGCGLPEDEMKQLKEDISQYVLQSFHTGNKKQHMCIGVKNTLSRLYLFLNGDFSYTIENAKPGFKITLTGKWREASD